MEFRRKYIEFKSYKANFIANVINEFIFILGLFFVFKNSGNLTIYNIFLIGTWYIFQSVILDMIYEVEIDIRTQILLNLILSKTSILLIIFKRSIVSFVNSSCVFFISMLFFYNDIFFYKISIKNIIIYVLLAIVIFYVFYYLFLYLCIIFERISTFVSFFNSLILIFANRIILFKQVFNILMGKSYNIYIIMLNIILLLIINLIFMNIAYKKIHNEGVL